MKKWSPKQNIDKYYNHLKGKNTRYGRIIIIINVNLQALMLFLHDL